MTSHYELHPRRELSLSGYLSTTMGRDAWKKALEVLVAEVALIAGIIFLFYALTHPDNFAPSRSALSRLPDWVVAICGIITAFFCLLILPDTISYCSAVLRIPFFDTRLGRWCARWTARSATSLRTPTTSFYFFIAKRFERVCLAEEGVSCGDDLEESFDYREVYKAFLSRKRGILVLRVKWRGGPRDIIADLSSLSAQRVDRVRDFLDMRLPKTARRYGFGLLSSLRTFGRVYDPWDCWFAQKRGGEFRRRWRGWHIPPNTPTIFSEDRKGTSGVEQEPRASNDTSPSWLPVGSVVRVNGTDVMILGRNVGDEAGNWYEYVIVPYPEGMTSRNDYYVCLRDDVQEVLHRGFSNAMEEKLEELLEAGGSALDAEWDPMAGYGGYEHGR